MFIYETIDILANILKCSNIIDNSKLTQPKDDPLYVAIAIDAAKFKNIQGKHIIQKLNHLKFTEEKKHECPYLSYIKEDKVYKKIFVFNVQPINKDIKAFSIHVKFAENGSANDDLKAIFSMIKTHL